MEKNPIRDYLRRSGSTQRDLRAMLKGMGWEPSESIVSRWVSGERDPGPAAKYMLRKIGIDYPAAA